MTEADMRPDRQFTLDHGITPQEWSALETYAIHGTQEAAAEVMGISIQTFKNHIGTAKSRLKARSLIEAYVILGWMKVPGHVDIHTPGERHNYALNCTVCGGQGTIRVSVDPDRAE
jgi:DNA-binding CsgD family transcriptional regulator